MVIFHLLHDPWIDRSFPLDFRATSPKPSNNFQAVPSVYHMARVCVGRLVSNRYHSLVGCNRENPASRNPNVRTGGPRGVSSGKSASEFEFETLMLITALKGTSATATRPSPLLPTANAVKKNRSILENLLYSLNDIDGNFYRSSVEDVRPGGKCTSSSAANSLIARRTHCIDP
jgi:hypothetical protein